MLLFGKVFYAIPNVRIFSTTFNASMRIQGLPWNGPYADLGMEYLVEKYAPWINFSLEYVLQDTDRIAMTNALLDDDIEYLMAKYYYDNVKKVDSIAHIYSGTH